MTYTPTTWVDGTAPAINATNLNKIEGGIYDAQEMATGRCALLVVAANNSSALAKQQADYVCDGTADQVQIQAAIDALPAIGGGVAFDGTMSLTDSIFFYDVSNISFFGLGTPSKLVSTNDKAVIIVGDRAGDPATDISLRNFMIDGSSQTGNLSNVTTTDGQGIAIENAGTKRITVENCGIYNTGNDGIGGYESGSALITNNIIRNIRGMYGGIHPHCGGHQFYITNNIIEDCVNSGIRHGLVISGNRISGCGNLSNYRSAIIGSDNSYIISNNYVEDTEYAGIDSWAGTGAEACTITNNVIKNADVYGIMLGKPPTDFGGTVVGNTIDGGCSSAGILSARDNLVISANSVSNVTGKGINLYTSTNNIVTNNVLYKISSDGIMLYESSHCNVIGNSIAESVHSAGIPDIVLSSTSLHNLVTGNLMRLSAGKGLLEELSSDYNTITNNKFVAITGDEIGIVGANTVVRGNFGWATETSGTDTLASAATTKVVTHGLAVTPAAGDIMVTPMESLGSASFWWIDTYTSTQFTIHVNAAPGADVDFAWKAVVL